MPENGDDAQNMVAKALEEANEMFKNQPAPERKPNVSYDDISSDSDDDVADEQGSVISESAASTSKDASVEERIVKGDSCKLSGNEFFKKAENKEALRFYNKGLKTIEDLEDEQLTGEWKEKYTELYHSLLLNKSVVCNRLKIFKETIKCCGKVIVKTEPTAKDNSKFQAAFIKASNRRGMALASTNEINSAKKDFLAVLKLEPNNSDARREMRKIKTLLVAEKARAKQTFGNIFRKNVNMYEDKEEEMLKAAQKRQEEEEKEKAEYDKEKSSFLDDNEGQEFESFDDWKESKAKAKVEKEKKEEEEKAKKEKEKEEKRRKTTEERRKKQLAEGKQEDNDEIDLDEDDLAAIADVKKKGYCHFRREKTKDEEEYFKDMAPSKLEEGHTAQDIAQSGTIDSERSAWNNAKTWEERDASEQVKQELKSSLASISISRPMGKYNIKLAVDTVSSVSGEAQIVFVSGKKGSLYDLELELKWKGILSCASKDDKQFQGKMKFSEITNGLKNHNFECQKSFSSGYKKLLDEEKGLIPEPFSYFEEKVREKIFFVVEGQYSTGK